jgi:CUB/sushi domain-containing protein
VYNTASDSFLADFRLTLHVNDDQKSSFIFIDDTDWHHLVVTWSSQVGVWQLFVDGVMEAGDSGWMADAFILGRSVGIVSTVHVGFTVLYTGFLFKGEGQFILGDNSPSLRRLATYLTGEITLVEVWDYVLSSHEIQAMHAFCEDFRGTLLSWPDFRYNLIGNLTVINSSFCLCEFCSLFWSIKF